MHTPTLIQTAFTAAALFGAAQAAPLRRSSVVEDSIVSSAPSSRRGSFAADEIPASRRSSIADPMLGSPPSRRGSLASPGDTTASRKRSVVEGSLGAPPPAARRASLASPADIFNARRRSLAADDALPNMNRRSSAATAGDIVAARRRSVVEDNQPARRSSLAIPGENLGARRRSFAGADNVPMRRSSLAVESLPNRKAYIPPTGQQEEVVEEDDNDSDSEDSGVQVKVTGPPPPASLPNRKAYIPSQAEHVKVAAPLDPASLPNRKAYIFPVVNHAAKEKEAVPHPEIKQVHPASLPNRKAYVFPEASAPAVPTAQVKQVAPSFIPNRKAFISPEDVGELVTREVAPEDTFTEEPEEYEQEIEQSGATAIPLFKREANPLAKDGLVNWDAAHSHLAHVNVKYEKGIIAYQVKTGEALFDSKMYSPEELATREQHLSRRAEVAEAQAEQEAASANSTQAMEGEEDLPTIEDDFMMGASEFAVGNPKATAFQAAKQSSKQAGVNLKSFNTDLLWAGPVSIGTPAKPFVLDFDTGSADTWVPSIKCKSNACAKHNKYDPSTSSTSTAVPSKQLNVQYGDGSTTSGSVYTDTVTVAGMTASNQAIGAATTLSNSFANDPMDGIMGMGYQSISQMNVPPFFQTLMQQNKVSSSQFSFSLDNGAGASELYLGGANPAKYSGNIEWHPVVSESYWVLDGDAYVDGKSASQDFHAIIDTGTTVVVAPPAQAAAFWDKVEGSAPYGGGYYTFPCNNVPEVAFSFGGKQWAMSEENINLGSTAPGSGRCVGSVVGMDVGISAWIIGDSFLKDVYTSFNFDTNSVGFAEKSDEE